MQPLRALLTCAGPDQRTLPLQTLVDRDGSAKTALTHPDRGSVVGRHRGNLHRDLPGRPGGLSLRCGRARPKPDVRRAAGAAWIWTRGVLRPRVHQREPFLLLVGDHLYVSRPPACAHNSSKSPRPRIAPSRRCRPRARACCPITAPSAAGWSAVSASLYRDRDVLEKPTPTEAEQTLIVPGLRAGHYLCFFGMHVLTPRHGILGRSARARQSRRVASRPPSPTRERERYLAWSCRAAATMSARSTDC